MGRSGDMYRHWHVTDDNHRHYLIRAESGQQALQILQASGKVSSEDADDFRYERVPDIASIDSDVGLILRGPPMSSEDE